MDIIAGLATIGCFVTSIVSLKKSINPDNRTARIRETLFKAKENVDEILDQLEGFRDVLKGEYKNYLRRCKNLNERINNGLVAAVEDSGNLTPKKRWIYHTKKKQARQMENDSLDLKSAFKISTAEALKLAAESTQNIRRDRKKAQIAEMKLRIEHEDLKNQLRARNLSVRSFLSANESIESVATTLAVIGE